MSDQSEPRQAALVKAGAMVLAAKAAAANPIDVTSRVSDQVSAAREYAAAWAKSLIHSLFAPVDPRSADQVGWFAAKAAQIMGSAQDASARAAAAGQVLQLSAMGIKVDAPTLPPLDIRAPAVRRDGGKLVLDRRPVRVEYDNGDVAHLSPDDMTNEAVFHRPASVFVWVDDHDGDASATATTRIDTLVDDNLMLAQRFAAQSVLIAAVDLDQSKSQARIVGYRRVIHPELSRGGTCGMCIAAADRVYNVGELLPIHNRCHCGIAAITEDHDPGDDVNAADLRQLYGDAGGTSAAHLKRTRYQIDEHGELGPILVPDRKYKPRSDESQKRSAG